MSERVPQSTRAILNTIAQLHNLERVLKKKVRGNTASDALKIRMVVIEAEQLAQRLQDLASKTTAQAGQNIEQVKEKLATEASKRRAGQLGSTDVCEEPVEKAESGADLAGVMVALYPQKALAEKLAVEGGEPQERLHVTLLYFEDKAAEREDWEKLSEAVAKVVAKHEKLSGHIAGAGRFVNDDSDVAWASLDLPGLAQLRQELLEAAQEAGFPVSMSHDFTPHMTLKYLDKGEAYPAPIERTAARFGKVYVVTGDRKVSSHTLGTK